MRKLQFQYHMRLIFETSVTDHHFTLRCVPASDERQTIMGEHIDIFPKHYSSSQTDSFGNCCMYGTADLPHSCFSVDVAGEADIDQTKLLSANRQKAALFKYQTKLTQPGEKLCTFYQELKLGGQTSALEKAEYIMDRLHQVFRYEQGVTGVFTTAQEAFELQAGVCQDYAHIVLSLCRLGGIACRYAAGMMVGEGATHAWVEILEHDTWIPLDPTHNRRVDDSYIKISSGRDAQDCAINQGVFMGGGKQRQEIYVVVKDR